MSGLFFVYCDTGSNVDDADFNDWYDEIHIPELFSLPEFLNGQRYTATDTLLPHYLGTFGTSTPNPTSMIESKAFKTLVAGASEREKRILDNAQTVNRRDMETIFEYPSAHSTFKGPVGKYLFVVTMDIPDSTPALEAEVNNWYNDVHIPDLSKINGWARSRRFKLNVSVELNPHSKSTVHANAEKYVALHEFTNDQYMTDPAMAAALQDEQGQNLLPKLKLGMRHFVLHREWTRSRSLQGHALN